MKKTLLSIALVLVATGGYFIAADPGHVPLFDANLTRLAETDRQGYCAGATYWNNQRGDAEMAAACREASTRPDGYDAQSVLMAFCQAIVDQGWPGDPTLECYDILVGYRYWPTYDGALTDAWNKANRWPGDLFAPSTGGDSRTGDRESNARQELTRP